MKKITLLMIVVLLGMMGVTGCTNKTAPTVATSDTAELSTEAVTEAPTDPTVDTTALFKDMSGSYDCSAGTKGGTTLYLSTDGTFVGSYRYFQTAVGDDEAPNGIFDLAKFKGSLQNIKRMGDNKFFADVSDLEYLTEPGTEEIINGRRYRYTIADHIASNDQFYIYTPDASYLDVHEDSLLWLKFNGAMPEDEEAPIGIYLLYNKRSGEAFYQTTKAELSPGETQSEIDSSEEHTGEELIKKNTSEILDLMDHEITVEYIGKYSYFSNGTLHVYFYNFKKLPGFVFYIQPNNPSTSFTEEEINGIKKDILEGDYDYQSIGIADGASLNNKISSDMTYSQISSTIGDYNTNPLAGAVEITQDVTSVCESISRATVKYEIPSVAELERIEDNGSLISYLMENDPKVKYIVAAKA